MAHSARLNLAILKIKVLSFVKKLPQSSRALDYRLKGPRSKSVQELGYLLTSVALTFALPNLSISISTMECGC